MKIYPSSYPLQQSIRVIFIVSFISYAFCIHANAQALSITATVINGTCPNNGQINILAAGGIAPYQFRLTAGPAGLSYPTSFQSGSNYSSLKPGTYTIEVKDAANTITNINKTVSTSYTSLNITSVTNTANHCPAVPDGTVKINASAGKPPYSYALLSGSTVVNGPQATNTFTNISSGTYTALVSDACGEIRSFSTTVALLDWTFISHVKTQDNNFFGAGGGTSTPPVPFDSTKALTSGAGPLLFTCDSVSARFNNFVLQNSGSIAVRRVWVKDLATGTIIFDQTYKPSASFSQASVTVKMKINTNYRIYYSDLCDDLDSTDRNYSIQTSYSISGAPLKLCIGYKMSIHWANDYNTLNRYSCPQDTITIIGSSLTGDTAIGKFTIHDKLAGNTWDASISGITPGNTYTIRVNTCCSTYIKTQYIGTALADASFLILRDHACKINTASFVINSNYLPVTPGYLLYTITSGPPSFTDINGNVFNISYPIKDSTPVTSTVNNVYIRNFPEGDYTIEIRDQCGRVQTLNTSVTQASIAKLAANITVNPQCTGASSITFSGTYQHIAGGIALYKKTGSSYNLFLSSSSFATTAELPASYTFSNLADGDYKIVFFRIGESGLTYGVNSPVNSCDTLFAQDVNITYRLPSFSSATNGFVCTPGSSDGRVIVRGLNGARPYTYQRLSILDNTIITTQNDSIFSGLSKATYRFRIIDNCGNGITNDISIDTLSKPSIGSQGTFCVGTNASFYYSALAPDASFLWTGPNGYSSENDTVSFKPVTESDLGKYIVTQIIPGCNNKKDSITMSACGAVPVSILKFSGRAADNCGIVKLQWQTAAESNLKEFLVEQSNNQNNFRTISTMPALNLVNGNSYTATAIQTIKNSFYRLATINSDGSKSYSNIIKVTANCKGAAEYIVLYPNPASSVEKVTVEISSNKKIPASIIINTQDGKRFLLQNILLAKGINKAVINVKGFAPGMYTITVVDKNNSRVKKAKFVIY